MELDQLLDTCAKSSPADWNTITCWGARSGPSYLDQFIAGQHRNEDDKMEFWLQHREHAQRASYRPDLTIGIGWGLDPDEAFPGDHRELSEEDWMRGFADKSWSFNFVDFLYCGSLVAREAYATVDGGRCVLPFPDQNNSVTQWQHDFFRVLDAIGLYISDYDQYFQRAGFTIRP